MCIENNIDYTFLHVVIVPPPPNGDKFKQMYSAVNILMACFWALPGPKDNS